MTWFTAFLALPLLAYLAAAAVTTQPVAIGIATLVAALSPLLLRYVRLDRTAMAAVSYLVAIAIAIAAGLLTGDLTPSRESAVAILAGSTVFWTVQQAVYHVLNGISPATVQTPPQRASRRL